MRAWLTRNRRDFDDLARPGAPLPGGLPDVVGRGRQLAAGEGRLSPVPTCVADMIAADRPARRGHGGLGRHTSMGLGGMLIASIPDNPIRRLVLNDVGPVVTGRRCAHRPVCGHGAGVSQFRDRRGLHPGGQCSLRRICPDAQWRHLTESSVKEVEGGWAMRYDPGIGDGPSARRRSLDGREPVADLRRHRLPTLVVRGRSIC